MGINLKFNYHKLGLERFINCALGYVRLKSWKILYLYKVTFYHGCSARLVIQAILVKRRVWQKNSKSIYEVCDLQSEKYAPMYCIEWTPLNHSVFVG